MEKQFIIERRVMTVTTLLVVAKDCNEAMSFVREGKLYSPDHQGIKGFTTPVEEGQASLKRRKDLES